MKNIRAKLVDFVANNKCQKEKASKLIWPFCSLLNILLWLTSWIVNFLIVLFTIPFSLAYTPTKGFQKLGRRNGKGYFFDSYSRYLKFHQASIGTLVAVIVVIAAKVILTFVALHPTGTEAGGGGGLPEASCSEPLAIYFNLPESAVTINQAESFSMSGHWCATYSSDGGLCTICPDSKSYTGQYRLSGGSWSNITDSTPLKVNSGTYSGTAEVAGDLDPAAGCDCITASADWTKTVSANTGTEGKVYQVRMGIANPPLYGTTYSGTRTINVKPSAPTSFTHSANTISSITWSWIDNSANETGYYVQDGEGTNQSGDLGANANSWQETGLEPNVQYNRHSNVYADSGDNDSNSISVYTSIETPTGISAGNIAATSLTISATGSLSNLASGNSGLYFTETSTETNSDWTQTNSWQKTGLAPNTQYTFKAKARNGNGDETAETATANLRTLPATPSVASTRNTATWYKTASFAFTNNRSFGDGGVGYYRYAWNKSATYNFTDLETQWTSGTLEKTATSNGSWYLHVKSYNADGAANGIQTNGPYYFDNLVPTIKNMMPSLAQTAPRNQTLQEEVDVDVEKDDGDSVSDLSSIKIRAKNSQGVTKVDWTETVTEINSTVYDSNWSIPQNIFDQLPQGTSYIDVKACDQAGNISTEENAFYIIKDTLPPVFSEISSDPEANQVTVSWTTDEPATTQLKWGATSSVTNTTTLDSSLTTSHLVSLNGLNEETTYYFKPVSKDSLNQQKTGSLYQFTTASFPDLIIANAQARNLSETSAVITWDTDRASASKIRYGIDTSFGSEIIDTSYVTAHSLNIEGLEPGTKYYYEIISWDANDVYAYDSYATFTTSEEEEEDISQPTGITVNNQELPTDSLTNPRSRPIVSSSTIKLSGLTTANARVVVSINGDSVATTADAQGIWTATFEEIAVGQHTATVSITVNGQTSQTTLGTFVVTPPAATILYPTEGQQVIERKPLIKGLAKSGHTVKVYIDDIYNGYTTATVHDSGTGSFAYEPFLDLTFGPHALHTVTEDSAGNRSNVSARINFFVVHPFVTPTVFDPLVRGSDPAIVTILGLAKNGSTVYIYLDNYLQSSFPVTDHPSGTASFAYDLRLEKTLAEGYHQIHLLAADSQGNLSRQSRTVRFHKPNSSTLDTIDDFVYTVKSGDSLWTIAEQYAAGGNNYQELISKNQENYPGLSDNPALIKPGWILLI